MKKKLIDTDVKIIIGMLSYYYLLFSGFIIGLEFAPKEMIGMIIIFMFIGFIIPLIFLGIAFPDAQDAGW